MTVLVAVALLGFAGWWFLLRETAPPEASLPASSDVEPAPEGAELVEGTWTLTPDDEVFAGYRIDEIFGRDTLSRTAAGRTPTVEGSLTVEGDSVTAATVTADLTGLESDSLRRDRFLQTQALEIESFPEARFTLTEPIRLDPLPAPGSEATYTAAGELTLHGVTRPVDVELEARWTGETIELAGGTEIGLTDFDIEPPDVAGTVSVEDRGTFEFVLVFRSP